MLLYHASTYKFLVIKRNQATMAEGLSVPSGELQNRIYLTPDIGFSIAMAAGPNGITSISDDGGEISFEHIEAFDPESTVYVYAVECAHLPSEKLERIDENQFAFDADELVPESVTEHTAIEVFDYYRLVDFVHPANRQ